MDLFVLCVACLTVFVNWSVKQFAICLEVVVILLLNVMEVFSVGGGSLLDRQLYGCETWNYLWNYAENFHHKLKNVTSYQHEQIVNGRCRPTEEELLGKDK